MRRAAMRWFWDQYTSDPWERAQSMAPCRAAAAQGTAWGGGVRPRVPDTLPAAAAAHVRLRIVTAAVSRCTNSTACGRRLVQRRGEGHIQRVGGEAMAWMIPLGALSALLWARHAGGRCLVLPQGRWHLSAEARFSLPITRRFTPEEGPKTSPPISIAS